MSDDDHENHGITVVPGLRVRAYDCGACGKTTVHGARAFHYIHFGDFMKFPFFSQVVLYCPECEYMLEKKDMPPGALKRATAAAARSKRPASHFGGVVVTALVVFGLTMLTTTRHNKFIAYGRAPELGDSYVLTVTKFAALEGLIEEGSELKYLKAVITDISEDGEVELELGENVYKAPLFAKDDVVPANAETVVIFAEDIETMVEDDAVAWIER